MTDIVERLREHAATSSYLIECRPRGLICEAADEIERLRASLEKIITMKPPIPEDEEGHAPNWGQYIFTRTWAAFAAELQRVARAALEESGR